MILKGAKSLLHTFNKSLHRQRRIRALHPSARSPSRLHPHSRPQARCPRHSYEGRALHSPQQHQAAAALLTPRHGRSPAPQRPAPRYLLAVLAVPHQAHLPVAALAHSSQEAIGSEGHPLATRARSEPGSAAAAAIEIPAAPSCHRERAAAACRTERRLSLWCTLRRCGGPFGSG